MPTDNEVMEPRTLERILPDADETDSTAEHGPYVVILYNDDYHSMDEVVIQIQKATGYDIQRCFRIMAEAHTQGRSIAYSGESEQCERVASILRQIRLQVETDRF